MKILVTGGAGFIGSHVVDAYLAAGHDVAVVDNLATGSPANLNSAARFHRADIRDPAALAAVFAAERPEVVNHHAAQASVRLSMEDPPADAQINVIGSLNVLEACRHSGVRKLIYAGTGGAAVGEPRYLPVDEAHPVEPLSPYGANKHAVEHYCDLYRANWGLDATILRYANIYGPRQDPLGEAGVIAVFAGRMLAGEEPLVNGSGEQERDYVYVGDVARANVLALDRGGGRMYNIGTGVGTSVNELFERLARLTGYGRPRRHGPGLPGEVFKIRLTADRARDELGWAPVVALDEGLRRTVESIRGGPA
ncbi:MAG: NAD-dependent epimerase/dehydratase family protein [Chloroflexota bacterium]|nr:NAD-dependent epimerase/dehydratase family protein [Chloroflexota bacterium]